MSTTHIPSTRRAALAVLLVCLAAPGSADPLADPSGSILLTVSGAIEKTNVGKSAVFDLAMLKAMPATSFSTTTIWTEGVQSFTGVELDDLLAAVGATGTTLRATALNDYSVEIPVSDGIDGGPVVAYLRNDAEMSVRDKGPLWIVYPYDSSRAYASEETYSRSIWQLDRIEVLP